jgi:hypothetical protein
MDTNRAIRIAHIDEINSKDDLVEAIRKHNRTAQREFQEVD